MRAATAKLLLTMGVATLGSAVLPDGPSGFRDADAQASRPQSRRLSSGNQSIRNRRPANANNLANNATRASRSASSRSATSTPDGSGTPPGWTAPPRPAGGAQAPGGSASTPVTPPPQMPAGTSMSRRGSRDDAAADGLGSGSGPKVGRVVPTVPMTAEERLRGYSEPSRIRGVPGTDAMSNYNYNWRGIAPSPNAARIAVRSAEIRQLQAQLGPKNDAARAARQASRRSSTTVNDATDTSPPGWEQNAPRLPADLQRAIARGTTLRETPPPMPPQLPGTLKLSRHLTRESVAPGLGRVAPTTVPMTAEERLRGYSEPSRIRGVPGTDAMSNYNYNWRGIAPSANPALIAARSAEIRALQAQLGPRNASAQAARQAQRRSATNVNNATDAPPPGWTSTPPRPAGSPQAPTPVAPPPQLPNTLRMARQPTREAGGSAAQPPR